VASAPSLKLLIALLQLTSTVFVRWARRQALAAKEANQRTLSFVFQLAT